VDNFLFSFQECFVIIGIQAELTMQEQYAQLWVKTKFYLQQSVAEKTFKELFDHIQDVAIVENNTLFLLVANNFLKTRIDKLFLNKMNDYISTISEELVRFRIITQDELYETNKATVEASAQRFDQIRSGNLNQIYTFQNYVIGKNNRLAATIALQVADQPGVFANPLYIFGPVGIGKTHLMQSIGNYIVDNDITKRVLYVKTENFVEDYVNLLRSNNIDQFNQKYADIDVLLIDDIQFLSKKTQSQQQFFKLFENLHGENKQIVVTSDRPTSELRDVMTRLTSRFSWGVVADINPPDLEHRLEILKRKLQTHLIDAETISLEVLELIANSFPTSVRELEGALNRVIFYKTIMNEELTLETAIEALQPLLKTQRMEHLTLNSNKIDQLLDIVCGYFGLSKTDLYGNSRKREFLYPRQISMFLLRELYDLPYKKIGSIFSGRDHSTVMNSCEKIAAGIQNEESIKNDVQNIRQRVEH
jgi:chromosomal replication initiator protein